MKIKYAGIYSYFYSGDGHQFYVKVGRSENINRRMREHKRSNPLLEEGPVIALPKLAISWAETTIHKICKELYEEIAPEHYKLTVEDRINFEETLARIETNIRNTWDILKDLYDLEHSILKKRSLSDE